MGPDFMKFSMDQASEYASMQTIHDLSMGVPSVLHPDIVGVTLAHMNPVLFRETFLDQFWHIRWQWRVTISRLYADLSYVKKHIHDPRAYCERRYYESVQANPKIQVHLDTIWNDVTSISEWHPSH